MIHWLQEGLAAAGLWESKSGFTVSVRVTARFEVYLLGSTAGCAQLVVKIPREGGSAVMLEREHRLLGDLHKQEPDLAKGLAPVSYGPISIGRTRAWVQSALPGRQVHPYFREETFDRVAEWRSVLAGMTRGKPLTKDDLFYEGLGSPPNSAERLELGWSLAEALHGQLPSVLVHGDLHPTNVLVDRNSIGAVDWVWAVTGGRPLFDWFDFCAHLCYEAGRETQPAKRWSAVTQALLSPGERLHDYALTGARQEAAALRIPFEAIPLQLALYACSRLHALIGHNLPQLADELFLRSFAVLPRPSSTAGRSSIPAVGRTA